GIQGAQKLHRRLPAGRRPGVVNDPLVKYWAACREWNVEIRLEIGGQVVRVAEGVGIGIVLDEEVEGVDHAHVRNEAHGDVQLIGFAGKDNAREVIAEGVL